MMKMIKWVTALKSYRNRFVMLLARYVQLQKKTHDYENCKQNAPVMDNGIFNMIRMQLVMTVAPTYGTYLV